MLTESSSIKRNARNKRGGIYRERVMSRLTCCSGILSPPRTLPLRLRRMNRGRPLEAVVSVLGRKRNVGSRDIKSAERPCLDMGAIPPHTTAFIETTCESNRCSLVFHLSLRHVPLSRTAKVLGRCHNETGHISV